jgi:hypothetical protein
MRRKGTRIPTTRPHRWKVDSVGTTLPTLDIPIDPKRPVVRLIYKKPPAIRSIRTL